MEQPSNFTALPQSLVDQEFATASDIVGGVAEADKCCLQRQSPDASSDKQSPVKRAATEKIVRLLAEWDLCTIQFAFDMRSSWSLLVPRSSF